MLHPWSASSVACTRWARLVTHVAVSQCKSLAWIMRLQVQQCYVAGLLFQNHR